MKFPIAAIHMSANLMLNLWCLEIFRRRVRTLTLRVDHHSTICSKAKFLSMLRTFAHAPLEEKVDVFKDNFYECLDHAYDAAYVSPHYGAPLKDVRLIDFPTARKLIVYGTRFLPKKIHKVMRLSPVSKHLRTACTETVGFRLCDIYVMKT